MRRATVFIPSISLIILAMAAAATAATLTVQSAAPWRSCTSASAPVFVQGNPSDFYCCLPTGVGNARSWQLCNPNPVSEVVTLKSGSGASGLIPVFEEVNGRVKISDTGLTVPRVQNLRSLSFRRNEADATADATTIEHVVAVLPKGSEIIFSAEFFPDSALTSSATDKATVRLSYIEGGSANPMFSAVTATLEYLGTGDWTQFVAVPMAMVSQPAASGDAISLSITKEGNGVVVPSGVFRLTYGDEALHVSSITPADTATSVPILSHIVIVFDTVLDPSTVTAAAFNLYDGVSDVSFASSLGTDKKTVTLVPTDPLASNKTYFVTTYGIVGTSYVTDPNGNPLAATYTTQFTTVGK